MTSGTLSPEQIVRRAKSNLAFALACLPKERRRDMIAFYAFCRVVDDIALDKYTFVRDAYLQRRRSLVSDGYEPPPEDPTAGDDPAAPAMAPAASAPR